MNPDAKKERLEDEHVPQTIHIASGIGKDLYEAAEPPYVSIYLPVHHDTRAGGRTWWDEIAYKDAVKLAMADLGRDYAREQYKGIAARLDYLEHHPNYFTWENTQGTIAFLVSNTDVYVYMLSIQTDKPLVVVGDEYYIKPLVRRYEHDLHYYVLMLSNDRFGFVEGSKDSLRRLPMPVIDENGIPHQVEADFSEPFANSEEKADDPHAEAGALDYATLEGHMSAYHGWLSSNEVKQEEGEKFFRYVNWAVSNSFKLHDPTPVIIAGLPKQQSEFRRICTIHDVVEQGIEKDPAGLDYPTLLADAVGIMEGLRDQRLSQMKERFDYEESKGKASADPVSVAQAVFDKKVAVLMVARGKSLPGSYDSADGSVRFDADPDVADDKLYDTAAPDVADSLAQAVLKQGGEVVVLPPDQMPAESSVAAIYRY